MAIAFETVATTAWAASNTLTITKPTGLAAGDLLIAHTAITRNATSAGTYATPSGWTAIGNDTLTDGNKSVIHYVFAKQADSGDAAASSFDFDPTDSRWVAGALFRISGHGGVASIQSSFANVTNSLSPSFANTVTPTNANSLLLFLVANVDSEQSATVSTYAITTSDPTWTERYDFYGDADSLYGAASNGDGTLSAATAIRPEVTATGNSSCAISSKSSNFVLGAMIVISPSISVSISPAVLSVIASVQAPSVTGAANVSPTIISVVASVQSPTVSSPTPDWTTDDKTSGETWTNQSKT